MSLKYSGIWNLWTKSDCFQKCGLSLLFFTIFHIFSNNNDVFRVLGGGGDKSKWDISELILEYK